MPLSGPPSSVSGHRSAQTSCDPYHEHTAPSSSKIQEAPALPPASSAAAAHSLQTRRRCTSWMDHRLRVSNPMPQAPWNNLHGKEGWIVKLTHPMWHWWDFCLGARTGRWSAIWPRPWQMAIAGMKSSALAVRNGTPYCA